MPHSDLAYCAAVTSEVLVAWRGCVVPGWRYRSVEEARDRLVLRGFDEIDLTNWHRDYSVRVTHLGVWIGTLEPWRGR